MKKYLIAFAIILFDWVVYLFSPSFDFLFLDYLPIFLTIILTIVYFIYSNIHKLLLFFIPVFFFCFLISIFASIDYVNGRARLNAMGLIKGLPHLNVEYRLYQQIGGCIRSPAIDIPEMYENFYLKSLIKIFGYQKGAFTAYFPTKEEIKDFIKNKKFKESNFDLEEKEQGISFINIHNINQKFEIPYMRDECLWNDEVKVLYEKYNEDILFIRIKAPGRSYFFCNNIFLDIKGGKYITSYYNTELSIEE